MQLPPGNHLPAWMGVEVREAVGGRALVALPERPEILNYMGTSHGGTLATLADVSMAVSVHSQLQPNQTTLTSDLFITYLAAGRGALLARAQAIRVGKGLASAEVAIEDETGTLVAKALGNFRVLLRQHSTAEE